MSNKQTITFEGADYFVEDQTTECLEYLKHLHNLNIKVEEAEFTSKQLKVAQSAFTSMFRNALTNPVTKEQQDANQEVQIAVG